MRKQLYFVATFLMVSSMSFAGGDVSYSKNKVEKTFHQAGRTPDISLQEELRNHHAWKNFLSHNGDWWVVFNEENRKPHRAYGTPISVAGSNAEQRAMNFILGHLSEFKIPVSELALTGKLSNEKHDFVNYHQIHNGLKVLESRLTVKLTRDGQVILFGADVFNDIDVDVNPTIMVAGAENAASTGLDETVTNITTNAELFILPVPENKAYKYKLVYQVNVETMHDGVPADYYTLVDAHNGEVLYRTNKVLHMDGHGHESKGGTVEMEVTAEVYPTHSFNPLSNEPMANMEYSVASTTYNTDGNGYSMSGASGTQSATFFLRGLWSTVKTNNVTPSFTTTVIDGLNAISFNANSTSQESSAYYHVNIVHDHQKALMPSFTGMDFSLTTNVDITTSNCNAFYNGTSINFYALANGCTSFATVGDVVYHEYGHGINDNFYTDNGGNFNNGGMGEGYADVWAYSITENAILGEGTDIAIATDYIRRYDINKKVYPVDITGEVHADGEIIAGAWWDTYLNLGSNMPAMMNLFVLAYPGLQATVLNGNEGVAFTDVLIDALQADDDDADLTNGTPNGQAIVDAFALHGITLISNANLIHTQLTTAPHNNPITINSTLQLNFPYTQYVNAVYCNYKINNGTWNTVAMTNVSSNNYTTDIAAQPIGTVVAYYLFANDINGEIAAVKPIGAAQTDANLPNFIMVSFDLEKTDDGDNFDDFGTFQTGLSSDNNTTGDWILSIPVGSFSTTGDTTTSVQPYYQHTSGGELCYFTANASTSTDAVGTADVDAGRTTLQSAVFDVTAYTNPTISYFRWYINNPPTGANPNADWWHVQISNDGGTTWTFVENTKTSDRRWRRNVFRIADVIAPTATMRMRFIASDSTRIGQNLDGGSLIEAAVDDIQLWDNSINSVDDESALMNISIFPNPASEMVTLSMDLLEENEVSFEIHDITGRMVLNGNFGNLSRGKNQQQIDVQNLSSGAYTITVLTNDSKFNLPMVKN